MVDSNTNNLSDMVDAASLDYVRHSKVIAEWRISAPGTDKLTAAEAKLREYKRAVDQARKKLEEQTGTAAKKSPFNRSGTEGLLRRRFFIAPSFEIYGGVAGLFDYGPPGCAVKNNVIAAWKRHFIVQEGMLELEASCLTPAPVLKASGHVDKFHDLLVRDVDTGDCYRADHLLADRLNELIDAEGTPEADLLTMTGLRERLDELNEKQMQDELQRYDARASETGNALTEPYPFNLMFSTSIGPTSNLPSFLRPETAQGIFVNFKRLIEYNGGKLPFACAQIGLSFRNEISPKAGLLRVREFQQAEIEHFVNADDKSHQNFGAVRDIELKLYGREQQMTPPYQAVRSTVGEAVSKGLIGNETLGYFIGRTNEFVRAIGMNMEHVRFRQHLEHEMAHYASDCWDLEINCSYGWIECAGHADRSAFDLGNHSEKSGSELTAREVFAEPREMESLVCVPNKGLLGRTFKKNAQVIMRAMTELEEAGVADMKAKIESEGSCNVAGFDVTSDQVSFKLEKKRLTGRSYYPSVIEPSFGIGRLLSCLWEHCYYVREGEDETDGSALRAVLALPVSVAPVKCTVLPLSKNEVFNEMLSGIREGLSKYGLINRVDDSGQSIGRRYARSDEIGTPFGVTVDFESIKDGSVTVRERDSTIQVRCSSEEAVQAIAKMVDGVLSWKQVFDRYAVVSSNADE